MFRIFVPIDCIRLQMLSTNENEPSHQRKYLLKLIAAVNLFHDMPLIEFKAENINLSFHSVRLCMEDPLYIFSALPSPPPPGLSPLVMYCCPVRLCLF